MEKTFILLRNHKQQGPYTLAQMAELGLQANELVYVENNVAGWRCAGEIDVLKPYISLTEEGEVPPTIPVKQPVAAPKTKKPVVEKIAKVLPALNPLKGTALPVVKTDTHSGNPSTIQEKGSDSFQTNHSRGAEPSREAAPEQTRDFSYNKKEPVETTINVVPSVPERYASKTEAPHYSGWLSGEKKKPAKKNFKKSLQIGAVALSVLVLGVVLSQFIGNSRESGKPTAVQSTIETPADSETKASIEAVLPKTENKTNLPPVTSTEENNIGQVNNAKQAVVNQNENKEKPLTKPAELSINQKPEKTAIVPTVTEEKNTASVVKPTEKTLQDQITVHSAAIENGDENGIYGLNVSVQNNSNKALKMVAVNVFYTNDAGAVINKQTLYFSDVQPGQSAARAASGHKIATKAYCKLGLVSSEGKIYYEN